MQEKYKKKTKYIGKVRKTYESNILTKEHQPIAKIVKKLPKMQQKKQEKKS